MRMQLNGLLIWPIKKDSCLADSLARTGGKRQRKKKRGKRTSIFIFRGKRTSIFIFYPLYSLMDGWNANAAQWLANLTHKEK